MKKLYSLLFTLLLTAGVLAGCGTSTEKPKESTGEKTESVQKDESAFPVTIKDALDNEVVIDAKPERIVSLIPSNTEIAFGLGLSKQVVGVSDYDNYPAEANEKEKIGGMDFNVEKILSLSPDLVLAHASYAEGSKDALQQLRDSGITVFVVNNATNFDQVFDSIGIIGKITGEKEKADEIISDMKENLEEIIAKAKEIKEEDRKSVFIEVSPAPEIYAAGKNTFMDEILHLIHAENVVTEENWPKIDPEAIIEKNPDVIITTHGYYTEDPIGQVLSREGWQDVAAVKNKRVVDIDSERINRTGPRLVEGVEDLAKAIYPETFK
ncbi:ABC transporter substrate-binding protein [Bacillus sp. FJAT-29790]|uniref:ABC transporter substrate-binding protein n=1 Tax=Bacillus sp. FJAT-29790 TaxID=1895002 RepID=UPI001C24BD28|nr:ABC transporter substrate-binding protein [Bacillus sp. FJAT-29790]MBU8879914.1 ABC transporter substrate-binding protein [Bacillus sp. FJAT-29790]